MTHRLSPVGGSMGRIGVRAATRAVACTMLLNRRIGFSGNSPWVAEKRAIDHCRHSANYIGPNLTLKPVFVNEE